MSLVTAFASATEPTVDDSPESKTSPTLHGRLPAYYGQVVTEEQRIKIYKIQADYQEKFDSLQNQLRILKEERDGKIAAVLTPDQKKQVEKAAAEAKAKRATKTKKTSEKQ
jgi:Spy/CpxP family protein refolding chaperone